MYFWLLCPKSGDHRCVDLYLGIQFYFTDQCVCFYAHTHCFYYSFVYNLRLGIVIFPVVLLLFKMALASMLILYSAISLKVFISCGSFLGF